MGPFLKNFSKVFIEVVSKSWGSHLNVQLEKDLFLSSSGYWQQPVIVQWFLESWKASVTP